LFAAVVAAATGGPYLLSTVNKAQDEPDDPEAPAEEVASAAALPGLRRSAIPLEGLPARHLGEVLRFDVTPAWVLARWGRVFTCTPEQDLRGYRVSVVTGTRSGDIAGSLTYLFDHDQRAARIDFVGTTGDPRALVQLATQQHGLERVAATDPGVQVFRRESDGRMNSELRIEPLQVVQAGDPLARYRVELSLARPSDFRLLSGAQSPTQRLMP
jgi:hypothetical protein